MDAKAKLSSDETQLFRALLEFVPDAMIIVDEQGAMVLVNAQAERLFGYSREELLGNAIEILVPEQFRARHPAHREDFFRAPRVRPMGADLELRGRRKDGTEFPVEISLGPIETDEGMLVASAIRDSSERQRVQETLRQKNAELESVNRAKDRFVANMSHELRTPLNAVIGFTGTLLMELPGPLNAEQARQLQIVQSGARHLLSLINDILDLAKIESGKDDFHIEPIALGPIVSEVASTLRPAADEKGLELSVVLPAVTIEVRSDGRAVRQILINLASNAIKYTERGSVRIELARDGDAGAAIRVIDTGIGIREEDLPRLFAAFEQLDTSNTRRVEGAGPRTAPELAAGRLAGRGDPHRERARIGQHLHALPAGRSVSRRILVVDDNPANLDLVLYLLRSFGYSALGARDGLEGWEAARAEDFDMVLTDILMPGIDGYEFARRLGGLSRRPRIVAVTALAMAGDRDRMLAAGFDGYLSKPIDPATFCSYVESALDKHPGR